MSIPPRIVALAKRRYPDEPEAVAIDRYLLDNPGEAEHVAKLAKAEPAPEPPQPAPVPTLAGLIQSKIAERVSGLQKSGGLDFDAALEAVFRDDPDLGTAYSLTSWPESQQPVGQALAALSKALGGGHVAIQKARELTR